MYNIKVIKIFFIFSIVHNILKKKKLKISQLEVSYVVGFKSLIQKWKIPLCLKLKVMVGKLLASLPYRLLTIQYLMDSHY